MEQQHGALSGDSRTRCLDQPRLNDSLPKKKHHQQHQQTDLCNQDSGLDNNTSILATISANRDNSEKPTLKPPPCNSENLLPSSPSGNLNNTERRRSISTAKKDIQSLLSHATLSSKQAKTSTIKYEPELMLALRNSPLVKTPQTISLFVPVKQNLVASKQADPAQSIADSRFPITQSLVGQENSTGRRQRKDILLAPQRNVDSALRGQGQSQRVFGVPRGANNKGIGSPNASGQAGQSLQGNEIQGEGSPQNTRSYGMSTPRFSSQKGRTGHTGHTNSTRRANNSDNNRLGSTSWRSTGAVRETQQRPPLTAHSSLYDDHQQPEWMDDGTAYDENQNFRKMQDIEDWKRRMRRHDDAEVLVNGHDNNNNNIISSRINDGNAIGDSGLSESLQDQFNLSHDAALLSQNNEAAARSSRFLRLFSTSSQDGPSTMSNADIGVAMNVSSNASIHNSNQLSKLFKVLGNKVSVGNSESLDSPDGVILQSKSQPQPQPQPQKVILSVTPAFPSTQVQANSTTRNTVALADRAANTKYTSANNNNNNNNKALSPISHPKPSSPAPINEALRGIVPTSVFRKSAQNPNTANNGKRPDSSSSSRSATPARNLPSWLLELSRNNTMSTTTEQTTTTTITSETLGSHDLVDTLEREFPALSVNPKVYDNQSISSLSVQASVGAPGDLSGDHARRSSIETQYTERNIEQVSNEGEPSSQIPHTEGFPTMNTKASSDNHREVVASSQNDNNQKQHEYPSSSVPLHNGQPVPDNSIKHVSSPIQNINTHHLTSEQNGEPIPSRSIMSQVIPPQMMVPATGIAPGMIHPQAMHQAQLPPMPMMPPHNHPHGFPPEIMFGMVPPPPPGVFGGIPPMNFPPTQIGGIPAAAINEHQQMMLMKMMMSGEAPPHMMFGQVGASQQQPLPPHPHPQMPSPHPHSNVHSNTLPYPGLNIPTSMNINPQDTTTVNSNNNNDNTNNTINIIPQ